MRVENPKFIEPPMRKTTSADGRTVTFEIGHKRDETQFYDKKGRPLDKKMMQSPDHWQCGDFLPVKNHRIAEGKREGLSFGYMIRGDETAVYEDDGITVKYQYGSIDELLLAGWVVD